MQKNNKHIKFKLDMSLMALFLVLVSICMLFVGVGFDGKKYVFAQTTPVSSSSAFANAVANASYGDVIELGTSITLTQNLEIKTNLTIRGSYTIFAGSYNITIAPAVDVVIENLTITSTYSNGTDGGVVIVGENASLTLLNTTVNALSHNTTDNTQSTYNAIYCKESAMLTISSVGKIFGNIDITNSSLLTLQDVYLTTTGVIKANPSSLPIVLDTLYNSSAPEIPLCFTNSENITTGLDVLFSTVTGNAPKATFYKDSTKTSKYLNYKLSKSATNGNTFEIANSDLVALNLNASAGKSSDDHYFSITNSNGQTSNSQEVIYKEFSKNSSIAYKNIYDYTTYTELLNKTSTDEMGYSYSHLDSRPDGWITFRKMFYSKEGPVINGYHKTQYPTFFTAARPDAVTAGKNYVAVVEVSKFDAYGTIRLHINSQNNTTFDSQFEPNMSIEIDRTGVYYIGLTGADFDTKEAANFFLRSHLSISNGGVIEEIKIRIKVLDGESGSGITITDVVSTAGSTLISTNISGVYVYYRPFEFCNSMKEPVYPFIATGDYLPTVFKKGDSLKGWATSVNGTPVEYSAGRGLINTLYAVYNNSVSLKVLINHDEKLKILNNTGNTFGALKLDGDLLTELQTEAQQISLNNSNKLVINKNMSENHFGEGVEDVLITITDPTDASVILTGKASANKTNGNITFGKAADYFTITFDSTYLNNLIFMPIVQIDIIWQTRIVTVDLDGNNDNDGTHENLEFSEDEVGVFNGVKVQEDNGKWVYEYEVEYGSSINPTKVNWFNEKLNTKESDRPSDQLASTINVDETTGWFKYNNVSNAYPRLFIDYNEAFTEHVINNYGENGEDIDFTLFIEVRNFSHSTRSSLVYSATNNFYGDGAGLTYGDTTYNVYSQFKSNYVTVNGDGVYKVKLTYDWKTHYRYMQTLHNGPQGGERVDQFYFLRSGFNNAYYNKYTGLYEALGTINCEVRFKLIEGYSADDTYIYTKYQQDNLVAERSKYIAQDYQVYDASDNIYDVGVKKPDGKEIEVPTGNGAATTYETIYAFPIIEKITQNLKVKVTWYGAVAFYGVSKTLDGVQESYKSFGEAIAAAVSYGGYLEVFSSVDKSGDSSLEMFKDIAYTGSNEEQTVHIYTKVEGGATIEFDHANLYALKLSNITLVINGVSQYNNKVSISTTSQSLFDLRNNSKLKLFGGSFTAANSVVQLVEELSGTEGSNVVLEVYNGTSIVAKSPIGHSIEINNKNATVKLSGQVEFSKNSIYIDGYIPTVSSDDYAIINLNGNLTPVGNVFGVSFDAASSLANLSDNTHFLLLDTHNYKIINATNSSEKYPTEDLIINDEDYTITLGKITKNGSKYLTATKNLSYTFNLNGDELSYSEGTAKQKVVAINEVDKSLIKLTPSNNALLTKGYVAKQNVEFNDFNVSNYQRINLENVINYKLISKNTFSLDNNLTIGAYFESNSNFINNIEGIALNNVVVYGTTGNIASPNIIKTENRGTDTNGNTYLVYNGISVRNVSGTVYKDAVGEIIYGNNGSKYYMYLFITPLTDHCFDGGRSYPDNYYDGHCFIDIWGDFEFYNRNGSDTRSFVSCESESTTLLKYTGQMIYENKTGTLEKVANSYSVSTDWDSEIIDVTSLDYYAITTFADLATSAGTYHFISDFATVQSNVSNTNDTIYILKNGLTAPNGRIFLITSNTIVCAGKVNEMYVPEAITDVTVSYDFNYTNSAFIGNAGLGLTFSNLNITNLTIGNSLNVTITNGSYNGTINCANLTIKNTNITSANNIAVSGALSAVSSSTNTIKAPNINITGSATLTKYSVTGNITVGGNLTATSTSTHTITGDVTVGSSGTEKTATITNYNISGTGNLTVYGTLIATGGKTIAGNVDVKGDVGSSSKLFNYAVTKSVKVGRNLYANASKTMGSTLNVTGNANITNYTITGTATIGGTASITSATFKNILEITGAATITSSKLEVSLILNATSGVNSLDGCTISAVGIDAGASTVLLKLNNTNITGPVRTGGSLTATSDSTHTITGNVQVGSSGTGKTATLKDYNITGNVKVYGKLLATGGKTIGGDVDVKGDVGSSSNKFDYAITKTLKVGGSLYASASKTITGKVEITGNADITNYTLSSTTNVGGNLTANNVTFKNTVTLTSKTGTANTITGGSITTGGIDASGSTNTLSLSNVNVTGNVTTGGNLTAISSSGEHEIDGALTVNGIGKTIINGYSVYNSVKIIGSAEITNGNMSGSVNISGTATITNSTINGALTLKSAENTTHTIKSSTLNKGIKDSSANSPITTSTYIPTSNLVLESTNVTAFGIIFCGNFKASRSSGDTNLYSITSEGYILGNADISNYSLEASSIISSVYFWGPKIDLTNVTITHRNIYFGKETNNITTSAKVVKTNMMNLTTYANASLLKSSLSTIYAYADVSFTNSIGSATITEISTMNAVVLYNSSKVVFDALITKTTTTSDKVISISVVGAIPTNKNDARIIMKGQLAGECLIEISYTAGELTAPIHYFVKDSAKTLTNTTCVITESGSYKRFKTEKTDATYFGLTTLQQVTFELTGYGNSATTGDKALQVVWENTTGTLYSDLDNEAVATNVTLIWDGATNTAGNTVRKTVYYDPNSRGLTRTSSGGQNGRFAYADGDIKTSANTVMVLNDTDSISSGPYTVILYDVLKITYTNDSYGKLPTGKSLPSDDYVVYGKAYSVRTSYPLVRTDKMRQAGWALNTDPTTKVDGLSEVKENKTLVPYWETAIIWASNSVDGTGGENFNTLQAAADSAYTYIEIISADAESYYGDGVQGAIFARESGNVYIFRAAGNEIYIVSDLIFKPGTTGSATYYIEDIKAEGEHKYSMFSYGSGIENHGVKLYCKNFSTGDSYGPALLQLGNGAETYASNCHFGSWAVEWGSEEYEGAIHINGGKFIANGCYTQGMTGLFIAKGEVELTSCSVTSYAYGSSPNYLAGIVNKGALIINSGVTIKNYEFDQEFNVPDQTLISGEYYGSYGILNSGTLNMNGGTITHTGDSPVWTLAAQNGITQSNFFQYHAFVAGILNTDAGILDITGGTINVTGGTTTASGYSYGIYDISKTANNKVDGATISGGCGIFCFTTEAGAPKIIIGSRSNTFVYSVAADANDTVQVWGMGSAVYVRDNWSNITADQVEIDSKAYIGYTNSTTQSTTTKYGVYTWLRACANINAAKIYGASYGVYIKDSHTSVTNITGGEIKGGTYAIYILTQHTSSNLYYGNTVNITGGTLIGGSNAVIYSTVQNSVPTTTKNTISIGQNVIVGGGTSDESATSNYGIYAISSHTILNIKNPTIYAKTAEIYLDKLSTTDAYINLKSDITEAAKAIKVKTADSCYGFNYKVVKLDGATSVANISVVKPSNTPICEELRVVKVGSYGVLKYGDASITINWTYANNCENDVTAYITLVSDNGKAHSYSLNRLDSKLQLVGVRNCKYTVVILSPINHSVNGVINTSVEELDLSSASASKTYDFNISKYSGGGFYNIENAGQTEYEIKVNNTALTSEGAYTEADKANVQVSATQEKAGNKVYFTVNAQDGININNIQVSDASGNTINKFVANYSANTYYFVMPQNSVDINIIISGTASSLYTIEKDLNQASNITVASSARVNDSVEVKISDSTTKEVIITYTINEKIKQLFVTDFIHVNGGVVCKFTMPKADSGTKVTVSYKHY